MSVICIRYQSIAAGMMLTLWAGNGCRAADGDSSSSVRRPLESPLQFAQRLRKSRKYEQSLEVLKRMQSQKKRDRDLAGQIELERGLTYWEWAGVATDHSLQSRRLDAALAAVKDFTTRFPKHARTAEALSLQGQVLLTKARSELSAARSAGKQTQLRKLARKNITAARTAFKSAYALNEATWKQFPIYIPPDERAKRRAKDVAEIQVIKDQLDLASTTYWEAQSHPDGTADRKTLLSRAADEYGLIHARYRTQVGGLLARVWQGKCRQERGEVREALKIYNELLEHPHSSPPLKRLQDQAQHFKLICLNHDSRKDYGLTVELAAEWLKNNTTLHKTRTGVGIRWQLSVAQEKLARADGTAVESRGKYLRDALANARIVSRDSPEHRAVALKMIVGLGGASRNGKPRNFADARTLATVAYGIVREKSRQLEMARGAGKPKDVITKLEAEYRDAVEKGAAAYRQALTLAKPKSDSGKLNECRYILAYLEYARNRDGEARRLAMQAARETRTSQPDMSRNAAYLALGAAARAHTAARGEMRASLKKEIVAISQFLIKNWPDDKESQRARQMLAKLKESDR